MRGKSGKVKVKLTLLSPLSGARYEWDWESESKIGEKRCCLHFIKRTEPRITKCTVNADVILLALFTFFISHRSLFSLCVLSLISMIMIIITPEA